MSTATVTPPPTNPPIIPVSPPSATPVTYGNVSALAKITVAQYQQMIAKGILNDEQKVELLEGYMVPKMPRNPPHDGTIQFINKRLARYLPSGWDIRVQLTLALVDSQPEPDLAVCRGDESTYLTRHPTPVDVGWLIEVADSSLLRDQRDKTRIYARAGIPIYWIVNLVDRRIEVYSQPSGPVAVPAYAAAQEYLPSDSVPLMLDGNAVGTIPASELLP